MESDHSVTDPGTVANDLGAFKRHLTNRGFQVGDWNIERITDE
jgi:hypothetical protein